MRWNADETSCPLNSVGKEELRNCTAVRENGRLQSLGAGTGSENLVQSNSRHSLFELLVEVDFYRRGLQ